MIDGKKSKVDITIPRRQIKRIVQEIMEARLRNKMETTKLKAKWRPLAHARPKARMAAPKTN